MKPLTHRQRAEKVLRMMKLNPFGARITMVAEETYPTELLEALRGPDPDLTRIGWLPAALEVLERFALSGLDEDPDATWEARRELSEMYQALRAAMALYEEET